VDNLNAVADVAGAHKAWFHVDGAFGALAALSSRLRPLVAGIERAHSIVFDLHKWAHVPNDAGFLLVRDGIIHRSTFANRAAYLQRTPRGLGAGEVWPCDLGPDLSRGFCCAQSLVHGDIGRPPARRRDGALLPGRQASGATPAQAADV
jgi:glutamate/tyrosine decarboxylase-like PLP-dependent enzyme